MEIIAHRGASHDAPENTLAAFHLAWAQGADAAECDVHLTRDDEVVVIHDDDTQRTTGQPGKVCTQTLTKLRTLDAGAWKAKKWRGEKIPTLAEVIATIPRGKRLFIEIKSGAETVSPLVRVLEHSRVSSKQVVIIGFSLEVMTLAKRALPRVKVYLGAESQRVKGRRIWATPLVKLISQVQCAGLDGLDVDAAGPVKNEFVAQIHAANLPLFVWTVNTTARARRLVQAGVDGITTNRPGWLREQLLTQIDRGFLFK